MESFDRFLDALIGLHAQPEQLSWAQIALRAFVVYAAVIVIVRLGKKRFLAQATAFDAILLILIGSIASRAVSGTAPFFASLFAVAVLVAIHSCASLISYRWRTFSSLIKGNATLLIKNGKVQEDALRASHIAPDDLEEDLRKKGLKDPAVVAEAHLERDGTLSVIKKRSG